MTLSELQCIVVKEAFVAYCTSAPKKEAARSILKDATSPATAVLVAARQLLGPTFLAYEPETLWLELDDPCHAARDKLMAAIALAMTPSFYWDYRVFGATTHALNDEIVLPTDVPKCTAEQMAWATFEAELLLSLSEGENEDTQPVYDDSVKAYVAVTLFTDGIVLPPTGLVFADEELKRLLPPEAQALRKEIKEAWEARPKGATPLAELSLDTSPVGIQLQHLAATWAYVEERTERLRAALKLLT